MKKTLYALTLCFSMLAHSAFAADSPAVLRVSLELLKNGKKVWNSELSTTEGRQAPIYSQTERSYVKECTPDRKGGLTPALGVVTTGVAADVTPMVIVNDEVLWSVSLQYKELQDIKTSSSVKGCAIELPSIRAFNTSARIKVKVGQSVSLPGTAENDKYELVIRAL